MNRDPNKNQLDFIRKYTEKVSDMVDNKAAARDSYREVYDPNSKKTTQQIARSTNDILRNPKIKSVIDQIQQGCRLQFTLMAPDALVRLEEMAKNAKGEKVKLQANIEILDRAGLKPPDKVEIAGVGIFGEASLDEIRNILRGNLDKIEKEMGGVSKNG